MGRGSTRKRADRTQRIRVLLCKLGSSTGGVFPVKAGIVLVLSLRSAFIGAHPRPKESNFSSQDLSLPVQRPAAVDARAKWLSGHRGSLELEASRASGLRPRRIERTGWRAARRCGNDRAPRNLGGGRSDKERDLDRGNVVPAIRTARRTGARSGPR